MHGLVFAADKKRLSQVSWFMGSSGQRARVSTAQISFLCNSQSLTCNDFRVFLPVLTRMQGGPIRAGRLLRCFWSPGSCEGTAALPAPCEATPGQVWCRGMQQDWGNTWASPQNWQLPRKAEKFFTSTFSSLLRYNIISWKTSFSPWIIPVGRKKYIYFFFKNKSESLPKMHEVIKFLREWRTLKFNLRFSFPSVFSQLC